MIQVGGCVAAVDIYASFNDTKSRDGDLQVRGSIVSDCNIPKRWIVLL
jgi:hypothetical protein